MNPEEYIEKQVGRETGFTVPEGYFEALYASLPSSLPERETTVQTQISRWQRVKPYLYLAAMFAGIWCMMKMFHLMSSTDISLDNPPQAVVAMLHEGQESGDDGYTDFAVDDLELEQAVSSEYDSFDDLSKDLGVDLEPEYERMNVDKHLSESGRGSDQKALKTRSI